MSRHLTIFAFGLLLGLTTLAQSTVDSLRLTLPQAEQLFLQNNLSLLAQRYSIDSARAGVITARLYDNPQFSFFSGLYQPESGKFFDYSSGSREIAFQYSQLVRTAGKRNKAIQLAQSGVTLTEDNLYDLLRTLRFTLRNDFYNIYYLEQIQKVYNQEITSLQHTDSAFAIQVQKGNIAMKELLRIRSELYSLQAELASLQDNIDDVQTEFKLLLRARSLTYIIPQFTPGAGPAGTLAVTTYQTLLDSAYRNRYDLKAAQTLNTASQQNLSLQRAMAQPDLTLAAGYDRLGSYVRNFNNVGVGFNIPIFNRNQGNIRQAQAQLASSQVQVNATKDLVDNQVANAYLAAVRAEKLLNGFSSTFDKDFGFLIEEVTKNYLRHNISLLEFIDFYDAYKQTVVQLNNLRFNHISQLEQLNFTTGSRFFNNP